MQIVFTFESSKCQSNRRLLLTSRTIFLAEQFVGDFAPSAVDSGQLIDLIRRMEEKFLGI